jgi:hypothetical protein
MEILANHFQFGNNNPNPASGDASSRQDIVGKLIGFITLTEEDRLKAGIYIGNEGRDWIDRSALILPSPFLVE